MIIRSGKKLLPLIILLLFCVFGNKNTIAQISGDSINEQSVVVHSPKKAAVYSALVPGLGQVYNKKYWKIPIIYAGFGALIYAFSWNNNQYNRFKDAYNEFPEDEFDGLIPQSQLENYINGYRRDRDFAIIGMAALWGLNIIDANVDAHFYTYDISRNITLKTEPVFINKNIATTFAGLKLSIIF